MKYIYAFWWSVYLFIFVSDSSTSYSHWNLAICFTTIKQRHMYYFFCTSLLIRWNL